jgi:type VI secretion system secreted protein Hcp
MKRKVFVLSLTLLFAALPMFAAAFDAYMKIESIPGESSAPGHQGWIEIESWSWGATAGAGKCTVHDFHFTKKVDRSSPALAQAALVGLLLPAVTVETGGERHMLQNVMVKSVQNVNGNSGPAQAIALSFAKCATHEANATLLPAKKATLGGVAVKGAEIAVKGESPNGMLGLGGGSGDPVALQDLHFNGPNQAVIAIRKAGEGTQGILIALLRASQTKSHIPQVTLKARKAGGNQQQYYEIKLEDCLVSSYQTSAGPGFDQITLNFARLDGPMTGFHDVDIK